jgi:hypothetical protein
MYSRPLILSKNLMSRALRMGSSATTPRLGFASQAGKGAGDQPTSTVDQDDLPTCKAKKTPSLQNGLLKPSKQPPNLNVSTSPPLGLRDLPNEVLYQISPDSQTLFRVRETAITHMSQIDIRQRRQLTDRDQAALFSNKWARARLAGVRTKENPIADALPILHKIAMASGLEPAQAATSRAILPTAAEAVDVLITLTQTAEDYLDFISRAAIEAQSLSEKDEKIIDTTSTFFTSHEMFRDLQTSPSPALSKHGSVLEETEEARTKLILSLKDTAMNSKDTAARCRALEWFLDAKDLGEHRDLDDLKQLFLYPEGYPGNAGNILYTKIGFFIPEHDFFIDAITTSRCGPAAVAAARFLATCRGMKLDPLGVKQMKNILQQTPDGRFSSSYFLKISRWAAEALYCEAISEAQGGFWYYKPELDLFDASNDLSGAGKALKDSLFNDFPMTTRRAVVVAVGSRRTAPDFLFSVLKESLRYEEDEALSFQALQSLRRAKENARVGPEHEKFCREVEATCEHTPTARLRPIIAALAGRQTTGTGAGNFFQHVFRVASRGNFIHGKEKENESFDGSLLYAVHGLKIHKFTEWKQLILQSRPGKYRDLARRYISDSIAQLQEEAEVTVGDHFFDDVHPERS